MANEPNVRRPEPSLTLHPELSFAVDVAVEVAVDVAVDVSVDVAATVLVVRSFRAEQRLGAEATSAEYGSLTSPAVNAVSVSLGTEGAPAALGRHQTSDHAEAPRVWQVWVKQEGTK